MKRLAGLLVVLLGLALAGCATGEAGQATSPVEAHQWVNRLEVPLPTPGTPGGITFTLTQTVTITPTSTATQTPTNTVSPTTNVSGVPR